MASRSLRVPIKITQLAARSTEDLRAKYQAARDDLTTSDDPMYNANLEPALDDLEEQIDDLVQRVQNMKRSWVSWNGVKYLMASTRLKNRLATEIENARKASEKKKLELQMNRLLEVDNEAAQLTQRLASMSVPPQASINQQIMTPDQIQAAMANAPNIFASTYASEPLATSPPFSQPS
ncbi:hypothetical protein DXG01_009186 [Tephrocybe rancida]|nr:hypothetical protein DXG01_009186 [Tephrocybe rancida]